jgi:hypothetical protein
MRYRIGDLLLFTDLEDREINVKLPQFRFYSRADDLIDLGTMVKLTEADIWQAIEKSGIRYTDWTARKEIVEKESVLHIYIEAAADQDRDETNATRLVQEAMSELNNEFSDTRKMLGDHILIVTFLPDGAFNKYIQSQQAAGADLAHLKPPHMQPNDSILARLTGDIQR